MHLYEILAQRVSLWRQKDYAHEHYPTIAEVLEWAANPRSDGFRLRPPQIRALETYWYLRLVEGTPKIFDLYCKSFSTRKELLEALAVPQAAFEAADYDLEALWESIKANDGFARILGYVDVLGQTAEDRPLEDVVVGAQRGFALDDHVVF